MTNKIEHNPPMCPECGNVSDWMITREITESKCINFAVGECVEDTRCTDLEIDCIPCGYSVTGHKYLNERIRGNE
jgi:hypothetical protein